MSWSAPRVLMYHCFGEPRSGRDPERLFVREADLRAHLTMLRDEGWRTLDLGAYLNELVRPTGGRRVLITIDDAHESALQIAAPLLSAARVPAVLFVPTGLAGGSMSWNPHYARERIAPAAVLRAAAASEIELGVHGYDHARLYRLDEVELHRQVVHAREELTAVSGTRPRAFAYPYGTHDVAARAAVALAGYQVAFAVARERGLYAADRIGVMAGDSPRDVRRKLSLSYRVASRVAGRTPWLRHRARDVVHAVKLAHRASNVGKDPGP